MPRRLPLIASFALLPALASCGSDGAPQAPEPPSAAAMAAVVKDPGALAALSETQADRLCL